MVSDLVQITQEVRKTASGMRQTATELKRAARQCRDHAQQLLAIHGPGQAHRIGAVPLLMEAAKTLDAAANHVTQAHAQCMLWAERNVTLRPGQKTHAQIVEGPTATVHYHPDGTKRRATPGERINSFAVGTQFNHNNNWRYDYDEITLVPQPGRKAGFRVDSYTPPDAIVSRKYTQLWEVELDVAKRSITEMARKFSPREVVADTPKARARYPHLIGERLRGRMYLEVPVQTNPIPQEVLDLATDNRISIIDTQGRIYN